MFFMDKIKLFTVLMKYLGKVSISISHVIDQKKMIKNGVMVY